MLGPVATTIDALFKLRTCTYSRLGPTGDTTTTIIARKEINKNQLLLRYDDNVQTMHSSTTTASNLCFTVLTGNGG